MKKIILTLVAVIMTVGMMAQQRREFNPETMAQRQAQNIKEACQLNDEQYTKIYNLLLDNNMKMQAARDSIRNAGGDFRQSFDREKMRKANEEQQNAIKAILTDDQKVAYDKYVEEIRQRRQGGPRNGRPQN